MKSLFRYSGIAFLGFSALGCGYTFQNSHNPLKETYKIERIYIAPLKNDTYEAGIENLVFNALVKTLGHHQRVKIVQSPDNADATVLGSVNEASFATHASSTADRLNPQNKGPSDFIISTVYTARLTCYFQLVRQEDEAEVWSSYFDRNKRFPASTQLGVFGTTSALINRSEFRRALSDLADAMMEDVHESMLAMF